MTELNHNRHDEFELIKQYRREVSSRNQSRLSSQNSYVHTEQSNINNSRGGGPVKCEICGGTIVKIHGLRLCENARCPTNHDRSDDLDDSGFDIGPMDRENNKSAIERPSVNKNDAHNIQPYQDVIGANSARSGLSARSVDPISALSRASFKLEDQRSRNPGYLHS